MVDEPIDIFRRDRIRVVGPPAGPDPDSLDRSQLSDDQRWYSLQWTAADGSPILANRYGTRDHGELRAREYRETALRVVEITCGTVDIPRTGDLAEWQAIHAHLFANVYPWAGQLRDVELDERGQYFLRPDLISGFLDEFTRSARSTDWARVSENEFIDQIAEIAMALNWAHPFIEGNQRSGRLFLDRLIAEAPFELDYNLVDPAVWNAAHYQAHPDSQSLEIDYSALVPIIDAITVDRTEVGVEFVDHLGDGRIRLAGPHENTATGARIADTIAAAGLSLVPPLTDALPLADPADDPASHLDTAPEHTPEPDA